MSDANAGKETKRTLSSDAREMPSAFFLLNMMVLSVCVAFRFHV